MSPSSGPGAVDQHMRVLWVSETIVSTPGYVVAYPM